MSADPRLRAAASAIAQARAARRVGPPIADPLALLERMLPDLYRGIIADAEAALAAADHVDLQAALAVARSAHG